MRESLLERCSLQISNEAVVRSSAKLDFEEIVKLGGLIFTSKGIDADEAHIRDCRKILKSKAGIFSNWRGTMNTVMLCKMSLADDPAAYFDSTDAIYRKLTEGKIIRTEYQLMCATTIEDVCTPDQYDRVIAGTIQQYQLARKTHPWLTDSSDMPLIALMVLAGADVEAMNQRAEECLALVKPLFPLYPDTKQMISQVMAYSDLPAQEKVDYFWSLYTRLKETGHTISRDHTIAILSAFCDLGLPVDEIAAEIGEVDDYLKNKKAYGSFLGVGNKFRRLIAAVLVLQDHLDGLDASKASIMGNAIAEIIAEQIIQTIIMIIVYTSVQAAHNNNNN